MLDSLFNPIYSKTFTIGIYLICTLTSLILGCVISFVSGYKSRQSKSMSITLILLPAIVQTVIMLVNGQIGAGIAVMGAFSLVRFRSSPGSAREILSIFLAMVTGLATAMGHIFLAVIFVVIITAIMLITNKIHFKGKDDMTRELRITVPEDLNYAHSFDSIFKEFTSYARLDSVKTTNMGSLYKLFYTIEIKDENKVQEFINELRCRNGNLEISVSIPVSDGRIL